MPNIADLIWEQAKAAGREDALMAATALDAFIEASKGDRPMPFDVCVACTKMLLPIIAKGLGITEEQFIDFSLQVTEIRTKGSSPP